jgi:SAM-dependent methyltransferase
MNPEFKFLLKEHVENNTFVKLTLSDKKQKHQEVSKVLIKLVMLKKGVHLSFVFRHATKDITKNLAVEEGLKHIEELLSTEFKQALLFTTKEDVHYTSTGKTKLTVKKASITTAPTLSHDKQKKRLIAAENNIYLRELGVVTAEWKVKKDMQDKYRQINKYIEILDGALKELKKEKSLTIADMGAGKGYLTFSLYDYITNNLKIDTQVYGVELRPGLVNDCNAIASKADFDKLQFVEGRIEDVELPAFDVLVALHACDTATDDAISRGIKSGAKLIVASPCCHKQVRQEIPKDNALQAITKHGILKERQAEIITDAIRALYLEAYGYRTQVFEFIATEHTPKNVIITALKVNDVTAPYPEKLEKIESLKAVFGIKKHYLDTCL